MKYDNQCFRSRVKDEFINHAILLSTHFLNLGISSNTFLPNGIPYFMCIYPEMDRNTYLQIILYIRKAQNDKLFKGINRHSVDTIRHAEMEDQACFEANIKKVKEPEERHSPSSIRAISISLHEICMVYKSWTHE